MTRPILPDFTRIESGPSDTFANGIELFGVSETDDGPIRSILGVYTMNDVFLLREAANEIVYATDLETILARRHARHTLEHEHDNNDDQRADDEEFNARTNG